MTRTKLVKYLQWDIDGWREGLEYILHKADLVPGAKALELGGNSGGISVCMVTEMGLETICSDVVDTRKMVLDAHPEMAGNKLLSFDVVDGLNIKYSDNTFDLVVFKSVLGFFKNSQQQQQFISEIFRVLKPGGKLCFLENNRGSSLHTYARSKFIKWGNKWKYVTIPEMYHFLSAFSKKEIHANGFLTAFAKSEGMKQLLSYFDKIISFVIPASNKYIMYGIAVK